jgi:hypothetical protein
MKRLALLAAVAACGNLSPNATPTPGAATVRKIVSASVHVTVRATLNVLADQGVALRIADEDAGRVETQDFDVTPFQPEAQSYPMPERTIRMIFAVRPDTLGRGSILVVSTVYQPYNVGIQGSRRREHLVPPDHPGTTFTKKIVAKIEEAALGLERGN